MYQNNGLSLQTIMMNINDSIKRQNQENRKCNLDGKRFLHPHFPSWSLKQEQMALHAFGDVS